MKKTSDLIKILINENGELHLGAEAVIKLLHLVEMDERRSKNAIDTLNTLFNTIGELDDKTKE